MLFCQILLHFCSGMLTFLLCLAKYECVVVRDPEEMCSQGHQQCWQVRGSRRASQSRYWFCWVHRFWAELWARFTAVSLCSGYGSCTCFASFSWNIRSCSMYLFVDYKSAMLVSCRACTTSFGCVCPCIYFMAHYNMSKNVDAAASYIIFQLKMTSLWNYYCIILVWVFFH